jgi:hypothetical protein
MRLLLCLKYAFGRLLWQVENELPASPLRGTSWDVFILCWSVKPTRVLEQPQSFSGV